MPIKALINKNKKNLHCIDPCSMMGINEKTINICIMSAVLNTAELRCVLFLFCEHEHL